MNNNISLARNEHLMYSTIIMCILLIICDAYYKDLKTYKEALKAKKEIAEHVQEIFDSKA